jgi:hypothetical protein
MTEIYYATFSGDQAVRFYPFTAQGYADAYNHAALRGYDIWETNGREPHALAYRAREIDRTVADIKSGKVTEGPQMLTDHFNRHRS